LYQNGTRKQEAAQYMRLIHQEIQAGQATIVQRYEHWEEANERN
jgi:hypothetical protein